VEIDIFLTRENNLAWHKLPTNYHLHEQTRGWWESLHMLMAHNITDKNTRTYQPGGVGALASTETPTGSKLPALTHPDWASSAGWSLKAENKKPYE